MQVDTECLKEKKKSDILLHNERHFYGLTPSLTLRDKSFTSPFLKLQHLNKFQKFLVTILFHISHLNGHLIWAKVLKCQIEASRHKICTEILVALEHLDKTEIISNPSKIIKIKKQWNVKGRNWQSCQLWVLRKEWRLKWEDYWS